ncbi:hypothetical protein CQP30_14365 [Yersinia pestis]|uniref:Uncharacterized protein n=2 Tax=Yersinia pseudotuberculosis complex TaxID=1649845 RepID=A0A3G5L9X3_YERPE|nr:hypothetical [Yersinia pestis KIM10+]AXY34076.1 hypothetical protein CEQ20_12030 [Yersinia pseudotuberculosis]AYW81927.1 hypothetical protein EGX42_02405 [Yersinia pestis]OSZ87578.1 hypothetical protein A7725_13295 [Yersinia pestis subsp. microtus bv. Caucasica]OUY13508.1 hypothetical protein BFI40_15270 [Yersinia pestis subsp. microtus bv. Altaica]OVY75274.1 hypothetical protein BFI50_14575 [Yersinia pestis subsp. microtus bv. Xilingolensis]OVY83945.1 hypothetical protein BFI52_13800 [Yer
MSYLRDVFSAVTRHKTWNDGIVCHAGKLISRLSPNSYSERPHEATDYSWLYWLHRQQHVECCACKP